jgi:leucine-zipper of insertion element IS481
MRLHGNAALSWQGRRRLARRVVVEGRTLTAAAAAAGVSVRCARKWVGRYRLEGESGLRDRSSAPGRVANRTPADRVAALALRRLRMTAAEISELLGIGTLDCVRDPEARRDGPVGADRARAAGPLRVLASWRARPHRHQEARSDRGRRRQAGDRDQAQPLPQTPRCGRRRPEGDRLGLRPHRRRRLQPLRLRRSAHRRESGNRHRLPPPRGRPLPSPRDPDRTDPDRQRQLLPSGRARARLPPAAHPAQPHPPLPAADKRQGRALHPHDDRRLAYGAIYRSSHERTTALDGWLHHYNHRRRHSPLGHQPPASRTNLLGSYN